MVGLYVARNRHMAGTTTESRRSSNCIFVRRGLGGLVYVERGYSCLADHLRLPGGEPPALIVGKPTPTPLELVGKPELAILEEIVIVSLKG